MLKEIIKLSRPKQWMKNAFIFAPLFFSFKFNDTEMWLLAIIAFVAFILIASAVYIFNDISDKKNDSQHPEKKRRPIASGKISITTAAVMAFIYIIMAFWVLQFLPAQCQVIAIIYITINIIYTLYIKKIAIADVMTISSGYVLRVLLGASAISVVTSPWIIVSTYLLALFLSFCKRYNELEIVSQSKKIRSSLLAYDPVLLQTLIGISCVSALLCYVIYTVELDRVSDSSKLVYTSVFVIFGLFRYLQLLYVSKKGQEPETILLSDKPMIINIIVWLLVTLYLLGNGHGMMLV